MRGKRKGVLHTRTHRHRGGDALAKKLGINHDQLETIGAPGEDLVVISRDVWFEVSLLGGWKVAYRLIAQDGQVVVAEVRLFPHEDGTNQEVPGVWSGELLGSRAKVPFGGITSRLLRDIKMGEHRKSVPVVLKKLRRWAPVSVERSRLARAEPRRQGRPPIDEVRLAKIAKRYVEALQAGSERPIVDTADAVGLTSSGTRDLMYKARRRGILTPTIRGRSGGQLTEKGRRLAKRNRPRKK